MNWCPHQVFLAGNQGIFKVCHTIIVRPPAAIKFAVWLKGQLNSECSEVTSYKIHTFASVVLKVS